MRDILFWTVFSLVSLFILGTGFVFYAALVVGKRYDDEFGQEDE